MARAGRRSLLDALAWAALAAGPAAQTPDQAHWAFAPVRDPRPPAVRDSAWPWSPIDRFILARLERAGLRPAPDADRRTLARRLHFDLLGLPPTPEEVEDFVADRDPDAYERLVDRLLASPHYAERQARAWLDVARYADTAGDNADFPIPEAWRYRNWVIAAFYRDVPFDEFLAEQIAGDVLARLGPPERYAERVVATGFLALAQRFGIAPDENRHLVLADTIDTLGRAMLGLGLGCARCHDDPGSGLTQRDYYALYGIFASTRYPSPACETRPYPEGLVPLGDPRELEAEARSRAARRALLELERRRARGSLRLLEREIEAQEAHLRRARAAGADASIHHARLKAARERLAAARGELERIERALKDAARAPRHPLAFAVQEGEPVNAPVLRRGDPERPGEPVPRGAPLVAARVLPDPVHVGSGRLQLARWLTNPDHPLTWRVFVNRVWQQHFGRGIVATADNFGRDGARPTHPDLLDWLARRFADDGFSVKRLHRRIVLSRSYRMSAQAPTADRALRIDPENRLLWRQRRRRLDAESLRDALLSISGELDPTPAVGPHPFPPVEQWRFTQHEPFRAVYPTTKRSIYLMVQRSVRHPFLGLFDGADPRTPTAVRSETITPRQAAWLLNSRFLHDRSAALADRLLESDVTDAARLRRLWLLCYARQPTVQERLEAGAFLERWRRTLASCARGSREAMEPRRNAWAALARTLFASNEFLYVE